MVIEWRIVKSLEPIGGFLISLGFGYLWWVTWLNCTFPSITLSVVFHFGGWLQFNSLWTGHKKAVLVVNGSQHPPHYQLLDFKVYSFYIGYLVDWTSFEGPTWFTHLIDVKLSKQNPIHPMGGEGINCPQTLGFLFLADSIIFLE